MQNVYEFLKKCGTYYLATVEGDQPRVRPFGTIDLFENKLYIQTGKVKDVSAQLHQNPKAEICAFDGERWLRVAAEFISDDRLEAKEHMLKIVFHLLEIANEIRIMSNSQIKRECESEEQYLERVKASESYLTERVASNIDKLLSDDKLCIDVKTSKELFGLMGGGIRINGEYVPVELTKVHEAILAQDYEITER